MDAKKKLVEANQATMMFNISHRRKERKEIPYPAASAAGPHGHHTDQVVVDLIQKESDDDLEAGETGEKMVEVSKKPKKPKSLSTQTLEATLADLFAERQRKKEKKDKKDKKKKKKHKKEKKDKKGKKKHKEREEDKKDKKDKKKDKKGNKRPLEEIESIEEEEAASIPEAGRQQLQEDTTVAVGKPVSKKHRTSLAADCSERQDPSI